MNNTKEKNMIEEANEQVAIESVVVENPGVRNGVEFTNPAEKRVGHVWRPLFLIEAAQECPRPAGEVSTFHVRGSECCSTYL